MLKRWPHNCRVRVTFTLLPTNCSVFTTKNSMKCHVNWIPLRIRVRSRNIQHQGWVLFERNMRIQWNPAHKAFHRIRVETNEVVPSNSNVILTRQTCSQRSSRVAGSKHRAIAFYFSVRISCMLLKSICRGQSDLGVCKSLLANRMQLRSADSRFKNVFGRTIRVMRIRVRSRNTQPHLQAGLGFV